MAVNSLNRKKIDEKKKENGKKFKEQLKKFQAKTDTTFQSEQEKKENVLDIYQNLSPQQKAVFDKEIEKKKIRDNYALYLKYVYKDYIFTKFHALICNICQSVVEKVEHGQKVKICISVPPQHGKSMTVTETLPSWFIGRNPDLRCIVTAYNADVAEKFGNKNRQLMKNYGEEIFGIKISESQDNKTLWDIDRHKGGMLATGILGGLTSNGGALVIVDDPFKNGEEANNPDLRQKVYDTFADSVATRARGKGNAIIVIHTRWHEDDLIGRLEKSGEWIIVNIPCVWEKGIDRLLHRKVGQTLCPELGFDSEWATSMQKLLGAKKWAALYQGKPYIEGGNLLNRSAIKFYNEKTLPAVFDAVEMSCDLTFGGTKTTNDNVCIGVWGRVGADHYLLKKVKKKMTFKETLQTLRILSSNYPQARKKIIEAKANGLATIETLNREIGGFVEFNPGSKSKQERFENVIPLIESGNVFLPDETIDNTIEDDIEEMLRFPNATHDDFVDMLSQYLLNYEYRYGGKVDTDNRFSMFAKAIRGF
ncbi:MAG: phage terminase large subunit [Methanobrevibacter sp.]|nr:phage terminase large subunit [Methanobrevibacter sp.]